MKKIISLILAIIMIMAVVPVLEVSAETTDAVVTSIEVLKDPDVTEYEYGFFPNFTGMELKVTYADDSTEVITVSDENLNYKAIDQHYVNCTISTTNTTLSVWLNDSSIEDEAECYISADGYRLPYYELTFVNSKPIIGAYSENASRTGEDMTITLSYADGTSESLFYENVYLYDPLEDPNIRPGAGGFGVKGCAKTHKGIVPYQVYHGRLYGIPSSEWVVLTLDMEVTCKPEPPAITGDANGDGEVSISDATEIQMVLASRKYWSDLKLADAADVNGDGEVSIVDATAIQKMIVGLSK